MPTPEKVVEEMKSNTGDDMLTGPSAETPVPVPVPLPLEVSTAVSQIPSLTFTFFWKNFFCIPSNPDAFHYKEKRFHAIFSHIQMKELSFF